eukprot:514871_1
MESGDKIILSKGIYKMENDFSFYEKDIQIEGMGKESILDGCGDPLNVNQKLSLSNISFNMGLNVKGGNIWLTNCIVSSYIDIWRSVTPNTKLDCMKCMFVGDGDNCSAITMYGVSTLSINECVFDNCGGYDNDPAIQINKTKSL